MGLPRSTYYAAPEGRPSDSEIVTEIRAITDEFECYGIPLQKARPRSIANRPICPIRGAHSKFPGGALQ
jgi:hypothetical protein